MSFDYDKLKSKQDNQSYWATTSDLFMVMSLVFLLLYVVAGLRNGTYSIQKNLEHKRIAELNEDLKQQLKVYNTLKEDYLETQASEDEMKLYQNLMGKLDLLQEEAKDEKEKLRRQALENEQKEMALNKYQQLVRNIVNSNLMAKSTIKRRSQQLSKVKFESEEKIKELSTKYKDIAQNLTKTKSQLTSTQKKLAQENRTKEKLVSELAETQEKYKIEMDEIKQSFKEKALSERKVFESKLRKQKMSAKAREQALRQFQKQQNTEYKQQLDSLNTKMQSNQKELAKAKERLNARKQLAQKIQDNFKQYGVSASVNPQTGDVVLDFGNEYFDTGKANLKPNMRKILEKSIPVYAQSLFADPDIAKKLSFVEIVGFASPTYKGKYIDPQSMDENDRKAINYNLDLSYYRARSIFDHIFDPKNMNYSHQKKLRSIVKVTGRSFLAEKIDGEDGRKIASGMSQKEFCKLYDCKAAQKVIIKFDIKN